MTVHSSYSFSCPLSSLNSHLIISEQDDDFRTVRNERMEVDTLEIEMENVHDDEEIYDRAPIKC